MFNLVDLINIACLRVIDIMHNIFIVPKFNINQTLL